MKHPEVGQPFRLWVLQEPCKVEGNENACSKWLRRADPKGKRRLGVKKNDTVEKRATGGRGYKVQGARYKEKEKPRFEFGRVKSQHDRKL
jgi:hypothetical protein